ncbi:MAG: epoxyqueuosine reductase QueH [Rickettsiales bacterium]|jgi:predicted adenine nucleotide alpha hydrolase (AANH) superfamily ATPase|nr:epoxyqueuosine reductase QueH [Rickettsiales bacterium]
MSKSTNKIALLSCCAPCSVYAIRKLASEGAKFSVLFFNPNIYPAEEYGRRRAEQVRLCEELGVPFIDAPYDHGAWLDVVQGLENSPEQGARCSECFKFRFRLGAEWARANGYGAVASVFGVSRFKNQAQVDNAARVIGDELEYVQVEDDECARRELAREFYKQKYCGCEFSIKSKVRR